VDFAFIRPILYIFSPRSAVSPTRADASLGKARVGIAPFMYAASNIYVHTRCAFYDRARSVRPLRFHSHRRYTRARAFIFPFFVRNNPRWTLPALPPWNFQRRDTHWREQRLDIRERRVRDRS